MKRVKPNFINIRCSKRNVPYVIDDSNSNRLNNKFKLQAYPATFEKITRKDYKINGMHSYIDENLIGGGW